MMTSLHRRRRGFTLIELMITLAIMAILASVAIPGFQNLVRRSRRSEAAVNLGSIRKAQLSWFHTSGRFENAAPSPGLPWAPADQKQNWMAVQTTFSSVPGTGFDVIGYHPEGGTWFDYDITVQQTAAGWAFTAAAYGDIDGDGGLSVWLYVSPDSAGGIAPPGTAGYTEPWNPTTCARIRDTVAAVHHQGGCGFPVADDF